MMFHNREDIFKEIEKYKKSDDYIYEIKPVVEVSEEISELQRLSEEIKEPAYELVTSTSY